MTTQRPNIAGLLKTHAPLSSADSAFNLNNAILGSSTGMTVPSEAIPNTAVALDGVQIAELNLKDMAHASEQDISAVVKLYSLTPQQEHTLRNDILTAQKKPAEPVVEDDGEDEEKEDNIKFFDAAEAAAIAKSVEQPSGSHSMRMGALRVIRKIKNTVSAEKDAAALNKMLRTEETLKDVTKAEKEFSKTGDAVKYLTETEKAVAAADKAALAAADVKKAVSIGKNLTEASRFFKGGGVVGAVVTTFALPLAAAVTYAVTVPEKQSSGKTVREALSIAGKLAVPADARASISEGHVMTAVWQVSSRAAISAGETIKGIGDWIEKYNKDPQAAKNELIHGAYTTAYGLREAVQIGMAHPDIINTAVKTLAEQDGPPLQPSAAKQPDLIPELTAHQPRSYGSLLPAVPESDSASSKRSVSARAKSLSTPSLLPPSPSSSG